MGSTSVVTDATGALLVETRYKPWGEVRFTTDDLTLPTRYTFTGQYSYVNDSATDLGAAGFGLMFYNARWYDPALGRFAQADTIVPGGVQGLDRYAYVGNSPVLYVDPSGHEPHEPGTMCDRGYTEYCEDETSRQQNTLPDFGSYLGCGDDLECLDWALKALGIELWEYRVLSYLYFNGGADAQHGVNYILANDIKIVLVSSLPGGRGARFDGGTVYVVTTESKSTLTNDKWALQNIIHEALHIEQGNAVAHSIEGERLAWRAGLRVLAKLYASTNQTYNPSTRDKNVMKANDPVTFAVNLIHDDPLYAWPMVIFYPVLPCTGVPTGHLFCM